MTFRLEFLGAEVGSNRGRLAAQGVTEVGWSFHRLAQRGLPKSVDRLIATRLSQRMAVHLYPGLPKGWDGDLDEFAARYEEFIIGNMDSLASVMEIDQGTPLWVHTQRKAFYDNLTVSTFRPVWRAEHGSAALQSLAERYECVAIPESTITGDATLAARIRPLIQMHHTDFHAIGCVRLDTLRAIPFTSASTMSWLSSQIRGETVVWDGMKLIRYDKTQKDQARRRHRMTWQRAGFDPDLIAKDDYNTVVASTIWAFQQLERSVDERRGGEGERPLTIVKNNPTSSDEAKLAANKPKQGSGEIEAQLPTDADNRGVVARKRPTPRPPEEQGFLPTLNLVPTTITEQTPHGPVVREVAVAQSSAAVLRQCDTCFVSAQCPAFSPGSACAFSMPVEVRTKDQLRGLLQAIIEMQGQRVAFARFTEELNGGYPDPNVSSEMDRLFKLVKQLKELDENKEFIKITAERNGSGGVLSALFGERAQAVQALPGGGLNADQTNTLISRSLD